MNNKKIMALMIVAITFGLSWSIRGSFGHEWGAAWAGSMGTLALVLVSKNKKWFNNAPVLAALGAIGWAVGGMSSYGIVIGYCRGIDFGNVFYGYSMLAVIGGLYGFIGGGFFGLGLESEKKRKPDWAALLAQMVAGAMLTWGFLIYQMEWFMTPPRSELWAAAFGASAALGWYLWREGYHKSLRVALFTCLGAGFGFAFGNFIQVLGAASGISYNWWNVMEFTLGFFGGLGLAYAVLTVSWTHDIYHSKKSNLVALLFIFVIVPFINWDQSLITENFIKLSNLQDSLTSSDFAFSQRLFSMFIIILFSIVTFFVWNKYQSQDSNKKTFFIGILFFANSIYYILFLIIKNGLLYKGFALSDSNTLYIPILLLISLLIYFEKNIEYSSIEVEQNKKIMNNWKIIVFLLLLSFIVITLISINIHDGLPGYHLRFE